MTVTRAQFLASHADFSGFEGSIIDEELTLAAVRCPATKWTNATKRAKGIKLLTAHSLELQRQQQALSAATATNVANGSSSPPSPPDGSDLDATLYGKQFKSLRRTLAARIGIPI